MQIYFFLIIHYNISLLKHKRLILSFKTYLKIIINKHETLPPFKIYKSE